MKIPPTVQPGSSPVSPLPEEGAKLHKEKAIEASVVGAAKEILSKPSEAKKEKVGGFWSWFGFGGGTVEEKEVKESADEGEAGTLEGDGAGTLLGEEAEEFAQEPVLEPAPEPAAEPVPGGELKLEALKEPLSEDQLAELAKVQIPLKPEDAAAAINAVAAIDAVAAKKEEFVQAAEKTEQVRKGWWQSFKGAIGKYSGVHAVTAYVQQAADYVQKVKEYPEVLKSNKQGMIDQSKQIMLDHIDDPQFVELSDLVTGVVTGIATTEIGKLESGFVKSRLVSYQDLIKDLIEINVAKGFANLARQADEKRDQIPNYGNQPSLVSILSLICQKGSAHLNEESLKKIEEKSRDSRTKLAGMTKELFPDLENDPKKQEAIRKLTSKKGITPEIYTLFPNFVPLANRGLVSDEEKEIFNKRDAFIKVCQELAERDQELKQAFSQLADDILIHLFPNKFADMEIPDFLTQNIPGFGSNLAEILYSRLVKGGLVNFLQESYEPLKEDAARSEEWKKDLQDRLGIPDLKPVMDAPSTFVLAFVKDFIQSNPKAVSFAEVGLNFLSKPEVVPQGARLFHLLGEGEPTPVELSELDQEIALLKQKKKEEFFFLLAARNPTLQEISQLDEKIAKLLKEKPDAMQKEPLPVSSEELVVAYAKCAKKPLSPQEKEELAERVDQEIERNEIFANLSQAQLANWIVESTQAMLHTEDPHLLGLGRFVDKAMNQLTLALLAKGAKLAIPEGEEVKENQFIKELTDRMIEKFKSLKKDEVIPDQFWKDFVNDLPLPPLLKEILIPVVIEKAKKLQLDLAKKNEQIGEIEKLYTETEEKVRGFKQGEELLSIAQKISEQVIEQLFEKKFELVSSFGFGDTVEELLTQYLPGVQIDKGLKDWLKENIRAFGPSKEGIPTQSIDELKRGIHAVILKALVNTIETNFKDNSENYAAALLHNIHQAFTKAISGFDEAQRKELENAFAIQSQIQAKKEQIDALSKEMAKRPEGLTDKQMRLLDDTLHANMRFIRSQNYIDSLKLKLGETLKVVNEGYLKEDEWSEDELPLVGQALVLHRMKVSAFPSANAYMKGLETEIDALKDAEESADPKEAQAAQEAIAIHEILLDLLEMSNEEIKKIDEAVNIRATIKHAEQEKLKLEEELIAARKAVEEHAEEKMINRPRWNEAVAWMEQTLPKREMLHQLTKEKGDLNKELDAHLMIFQVLSAELTALLGLDQKDKLKLPPIVIDYVWPFIESAKKEQIARLLFEQLTPMILIIADVQKNKDRLTELSNGDSFLTQLAASISAEVVGCLSDYVTNYRPFAEQILVILGPDAPTDKEIERMEGSLRLTMIAAGSDGVKASMLKPLLKDSVPGDKEEAISQALENWIETEEEEEELSAERMLEILTKEMAPSNDKEKEDLVKKAKYLAHRVNEFLINRGKGNLTPEDLLDAYQEQVDGRQKKVATNDIPGTLHDLTSEKVIEKIKNVVITHDEIAQALNEIIPGAKDLHTLIAPQLEAVITGQDEALKANRKFVQEYIEGMLLHFFVKIGEANLKEGESILTVLANKLAELAHKLEKPEAVPEYKGKSAEEIAHLMVDKVLKDVLGIDNKNDLDGIPIVLRKKGFEKLKEQAYQHLTPLLLPMIEVKQSRETLRNLSGNHFLGNLSKALAKDLYTLLPLAVNSYRSIAIDLFEQLAGRPPTADEAGQFAQEIAQLVKLNKEGVVTNRTLVDAYAKVAKVALTDADEKELTEQLDVRKAIEEILDILITPEEITEKIQLSMPNVDPVLMKAFTGELQGLIHSNPAAYQHFSVFAEAFTEGVLLNLFIRIAEKNPRQPGKDTLIVLTEKLLQASTAKIEEAKSSPPEAVALQLNDVIMNDLLGIDSSEAFKGLPDPLQETAYREIKELLGGFLLRILKGVATLESGEETVIEAQKNIKKFGSADEAAAKGYAQILAEDLANMVVTAVPNVLTEMGADQMKGVNVISKGLESYLEELAQKNLEIASVILKYSKGERFQEMLGGVLENLGEAGKHEEEKKKAADLIANLFLVPLNQVLNRAVDFEKEQGEAFNQELMANVLVVAAGHFKNLNAARKLAGEEGRTALLHRDFVAAAGEGLHPAVPREAVSFEKTIQAINGLIYSKLLPRQQKKWNAEEGKLRLALTLLAKKESSGEIVMTVDDVVSEVNTIYKNVTGNSLKPGYLKALKELPLRDLVREEAEAPAVLRRKEAFDPAIQTAMQMIFPNGKKDLTFVPVELRNQVWKIFEKDLFPVVLPMMTELLLDPDVINSLVLSSLETMRDTLKEPIVLEKGEAKDRPLDALDEASGELISEMLSTVTLPEWIKNQMVDPKTGKTYDEMKKVLGATLRKQFNNTFIKDKMELALEKIVERKNEDYLLKPDTTARAEKLAKAEAKREAVQKDLKRVTREVIDVSISYFIRSKWAEAQARFDELIARAFGKIGKKVKQALDAVFRFIFFKIVGTLLSLLFYPIKGVVKNIIYDTLSLDENREILLSLLTQAPTDQPLTQSHVVYNEDLVYRLGKTIKETVKAFNETVDECLTEPVLPVETRAVQDDRPIEAG